MNEQNIIHNAIFEALSNQPRRRIDQMLWVSDLGKNPYATLKRILTGEMEPFDYPTLLKMDGGNALEAASLRQIAENLNRPIKTQFPLFNNTWSGYADLVIGHGTNDVIIYDHKGSAGKWWDYRGSLPRTSDCLQVWMYGRLYLEMYGIRPQLGLYYRGWGTWAEFRIHEAVDHQLGFILEASGEITDEKGIDSTLVKRARRVNPYHLKVELERYYTELEAGKISIEDIEAMNPNGPDWDYAENTCEQWAAQEAAK